MILCINTISNPSYIGLFSTHRELVKEQYVELRGNESSKFLPLLEDFLRDASTSFSDLQHIIVVNGPGSFTGVRTIVLTVNTLAFIYPSLSLTPLSYFSLFNSYPIVTPSSKRDCFLQEDAESEVSIKPYSELDMQKQYFGQANFPLKTLENINYSAIIKDIQLENYKKIEPLYIKKPNIS